MRVLLNKVSMMDNPEKPRNEKQMISYGARLMHLNRDNGLDRSFNVLTRLHFEYGLRKWFGWHYFAGVNLNYFIHQDGESAVTVYHVQAPVADLGRVGKYFSSAWPGYSVGIQF
jgi:hypothetical protein